MESTGDNKSAAGAASVAAALKEKAVPVGANPQAGKTATSGFDTGLLSLVLLSRFHGIAADPNNLRHNYEPSSKAGDDVALVRAARSLGLKAKAKNYDAEHLAHPPPLPAMAKMNDGRWLILAKIADGKVLSQEPTSPKPEITPLEEFTRKWSGQLILLTRRAGLTGAQRRFDLSWFWPEVVRHKRLFIEVLFVSFMLQILALVSPLFFQAVVDKVLAHRGITTLNVLVLAFAVTSIFEVVLTILRTYTFSHTTSRIDVMLGARLFSHLLRLPQSYFASRRVGDSVARVRELETIREFLTSSALMLVIDLVFVFVFLAVMATYSLALTAIVLASIPLFAGLSIAVTPMLRRRMEEKFARGAENQAFLVENVAGVETLKASACEPQAQQRWEELLAAYVKSGFKAVNLSNVAGQLCQMISKLTTVATLYFGALAVINGDLTVGGLVAFNMMSGRVTGPVLRLAQFWQDFCKARIAVDRLGDILNTAVEPAAGSGRGALPQISGNIKLDHVTFRYRAGSAPVLNDLSLEIAAGQSIGIVGSSGSGKSTLAKLIQRLYIPESGRVMVDGIDLALSDPVSLRRQVGVVLQENILFNRTVRDNIALSNPGLSLDRIITASKMAGAHDFICSLPEGYDTIIEERGSSLSGGQRQRIAIARALVTDPRILIFDEATSALDLESEYAIQRNMREICKNRTVVIIAHRLVAVRDCDRIITLENGRIIEDGTHERLVHAGGRYASLHRRQVGVRSDEKEVA